MSSTPTISVVLPTHNGSRYIDQSIQSVVEQTFKDWELIIVDDASNDETPAKIAAWITRDSRISAVRLDRNRKLPGALNEGFRRALGEFFTWTSDDNWYKPEALATMLEVLRAKPEVGVVYADMHWVDAAGHLRNPCPIKPPEHLVFGNCVFGCFLYRRQVHERLGGYDEGLFLVEDYDFWLRASNETKFHPIFEPLYFYRRHDRSLTRERAKEASIALERLMKRWLPEANWLDREARIDAYAYWIARSFKAGGCDAELTAWPYHGDKHVDSAMCSQILPRLLDHLVEVAWSSYWRRDWQQLAECRSYVLTHAEDPMLASRLPVKRYPKFCYTLKDWLERLWNRLATGEDGRAPSSCVRRSMRSPQTSLPSAVPRSLSGP